MTMAASSSPGAADKREKHCKRPGRFLDPQERHVRHRARMLLKIKARSARVNFKPYILPLDRERSMWVEPKENTPRRVDICLSRQKRAERALERVATAL